jgi:hypothetical protein
MRLAIAIAIAIAAPAPAASVAAPPASAAERRLPSVWEQTTGSRCRYEQP